MSISGVCVFLLHLEILDDEWKLNQEDQRAGNDYESEEINVPAVIEIQNGEIIHRRLADEEEVGIAIDAEAVHNERDNRRSEKELQIVKVGLDAEIDLLDRHKIEAVEYETGVSKHILPDANRRGVNALGGNEQSHSRADEHRRNHEALDLCADLLVLDKVKENNEVYHHRAEVEGEIALLYNESAELRVNLVDRDCGVEQLCRYENKCYDMMHRLVRGAELFCNDEGSRYNRKDTAEPDKMCEREHRVDTS